MQLLATKILAPDFKDRLIQQDFSIVEFPFVTIIPLPFPEVFLEKHIILTSQNATQFLLAQDNISELCSRSFFYCVGEGSAQLLRGHHATVVEYFNPDLGGIVADLTSTVCSLFCIIDPPVKLWNS